MPEYPHNLPDALRLNKNLTKASLVEQREETEAVSPINAAIAEALGESFAAQLALRNARRKKQPQLPAESEAYFGVKKQTIEGLCTGNGIALHYEFRPVRDEEIRGHVKLGGAAFVAVGQHGEGENVPGIVEEVRRSMRLLKLIEDRDQAGWTKLMAGAEPESELETELREVNFQLGRLKTKQLLADVLKKSPKETRTFLLQEIERQIALYEQYCKEYRENTTPEERGPLFLGQTNVNGLDQLEEFLSLLIAHRQTLL